MRSRLKFDPNEPRNPHTGEWIGGGIPNLDEAASSVATSALAWASFRGDSNPPSHDEVTANWRKQLKGRISDNANAHEAVQAAGDENAANSQWQEILAKFPPENVVVVKPPRAQGERTPGQGLTDVDGAAQRIGGTTQVREDDALLANGEKHPLGGERPNSSVNLGGLAALLRHEYGHSLADLLSPETMRKLREALPNPGQDLSRYSGTGSQELVPELLAIVTDPNYNEADWPPSVVQAGHILLDAIRALKPPAKATTLPTKRTSDPMRRKDFQLLETKTGENGSGEFTALVSVFGNVDHVGDRMVHGAFKKTLANWRKSGDPVPVILSHNWDDPMAHIGVANPNDMKETAKGLLVRGTLDIHDNPVAAQVYKLMKRRSLKEFSFGYQVPDGGEEIADDGANDVKEVSLIEVGPTLRGANPDTELQSIKAELGIEDKETPSKSEDQLRRETDKQRLAKLTEGVKADPHYAELETEIQGLKDALKEHDALKAQVEEQEAELERLNAPSEDELRRRSDEHRLEEATKDLPPAVETKGHLDVGPAARAHLHNLIAYYMEKPHPFTACVHDNTKRFGPDGAKRVCATLKDIGMGTTHWRHGGSSHDPETKADTPVADPAAALAEERDFAQELYDAAQGDFEALMEMWHEHMVRNGDKSYPAIEDGPNEEPSPAKSGPQDSLKQRSYDIALELARGDLRDVTLEEPTPEPAPIDERALRQRSFEVMLDIANG